MIYKYILVGHEPTPVEDVLEWAKWFETGDRRVAGTRIWWVEVSTVFLGLDHNFGFEEGERPILFETMVFGGLLDGEQERYATWDEALAGHQRLVREVMLAHFNPMAWVRWITERIRRWQTDRREGM